HIKFPNHAKILDSEFHSIDNDRILIHSSFWLTNEASNDNSLTDEASNGNVESSQCFIRVVSLSKGTFFERKYPADYPEKLFLISVHNLAVLYSTDYLSMIVISLLNGEILRDINMINIYEIFGALSILLARSFLAMITSLTNTLLLML
ncbi:hypothetical protein BDF19DRAFT_451626, partial [Syncephalis fuscata]